MSFNAMRKAAASKTELSDHADDGPPLDVAPKLSVVADAAKSDAAPATAATSGAVHQDATTAPGDTSPAAAVSNSDPSPTEALADAKVEAGAAAEPSAPSSFDDELAAVVVERDITSESVLPPTETEAEAEKRVKADDDDGLDPGMADKVAAGKTDATKTEAAPSASAQAEPAPSSEPAGDASGAAGSAEAAAEPEPYKIDEEELRGYGLDKPTMDAIAGLNAEQARDVIAEIRSKNSFVNDLQKKKGELENAIRARDLSTPQGGGLFSALASIFRKAPSEVAALRRTDGTLDEVQTYLGNENIRNRVHDMRRKEIFDAANALSSDNRRLSAASKAFNAALLSTPAGQAFDAEINAICERRPDLDRRKVIAMHMDGSLPKDLGAEKLSEHVREAFQSDHVKNAWNKVAAAGDAIEKRGQGLVDRMNAYEDHFPGSTDTENLREAVDKGIKGLEKTFDEPMTQDPEAERAWKDRLAKLMKAIQEFLEKLLAKFGFGPKL